MSLAPNTQLGHYQLLSLLGSGGMGEVYRAKDPRLGRDVAVKILPSAFSTDPDRLSRFEREARSAAALNHPNIVVIYDIGNHQGVPYVVSELLEGETLREALARGALAVRRVVDYAMQVANGLTAAHARGIVHRDLKPDNLFVTTDGRVKIFDFGIAKLTLPLSGTALDPEMLTAAPTRSGALVGTVGYMAPEQVRGAAVDARTDVFALGVILYELVSGQRPFQRESPAETMSAVVNEDPPDLITLSRRAVPPALARLIRRSLAKDPEERFQSARDVRFALETISDLEPEPAQASTKKTDEKSIGVLPFANMSADPDNEYLSDGLADELISALGRLSGLRVAARTSAFRFRGRDTDVREIGRQLNVEYVLEGTVKKAGKRLRVTAQLVNASTGYQVWSERYDREVEDVFAIQDEITESIVRTIEPTLLADRRRAPQRQTDNVQAYELYLKGRHLWHQRTPSSLRAAVGYFEDAARLDPNYALAYAGLADSHEMLTVYGFVPTGEGRAQAESAVKRALALGPHLAEPHFAMALFTYFLTEEWAGAEPHFREALRIDPRSSLVHAYFATFLATRHRCDEAQVHATEATTVDPLSAVVHAHAALTMYICHQYDEAVRTGERALELEADFMLGLASIALACSKLGKHDRAIAAVDRLVSISQRAPVYVSLAGLAYAAAGRRSEAFLLLDELLARSAQEYVAPTETMRIWLGLGHREPTFRALEACLEAGIVGPRIENFVGPHLTDLCSEPRFAELFGRLRLAVASQQTA